MAGEHLDPEFSIHHLGLSWTLLEKAVKNEAELPCLFQSQKTEAGDISSESPWKNNALDLSTCSEILPRFPYPSTARDTASSQHTPVLSSLGRSSSHTLSPWY